jgi:radical SAM enzyme (TIGR01210 family)
MSEHLPDFNDSWILSKRGPKNTVDPFKPYAWMVEKERSPSGTVVDTGVIFLTNRECPFQCLMCDLWRNTTNKKIPAGAIPEQIQYALNRMPDIRQLKLYNSGSFFDPSAIPIEDYDRIADLVSHVETLVVESHTHFLGQNVLDFRKRLTPKLEIAIGLENIHPFVISQLNKKMDPEDFRKAVVFLRQNNIATRAFVLLKPPFLNEEEGVLWAEKSIDFAFDAGVECCVIIPVRAGNGAMEFLLENGYFSYPLLESLEKVLEYGISLKRGRVFADTWDLGLFSTCNECLSERTKRLIDMNLHQAVSISVECSCMHSTRIV